MELEFNNKSESITAKDIADVERKNKFIFPQEIKSFLLANNGGQPNKTIYTQNSQDYVVDFFLPIKSTEFEDLTYSATITDLSDIIPNTVIPFAIDPFGNYFVFDKAEGKIYFLEMEEVALSLLASDFESEPQLIADSIDDFFNNLVAFPKIEEEQQTEIIEIEGVMPELSDCSASLTKEDIKNFEVELNVKIPAGMKNFYLKFNGGMPSPYCFQPQDEDLDRVEINAFFPIKERTNAFETIEVIAKDIWSRNLMPCNLLPFAMDSGGNYYALNLKNKKIYYYVTDEWDENASREYNFETNTRYIAQSFNYFINHFIEEEE